MKKLILSLILSFSLCIVGSVMSNNAEYPPNPHDCCVYCPYYEQELCFWNDSNFLYMSVDPDSVGKRCDISVIQDEFQYSSSAFDENDNSVNGDIYIYIEVRLVERYYSLSSPFDSTRPMTLIITDCDYSGPTFFEYIPIPPTTTTTMIPKTTTTTTSSSTCISEVLYGENSEEVKVLRFLRDEILSRTPTGREIIRLYYDWSPMIVKTTEEDGEFKEEVKEMIDGVLAIIGERLNFN